MWAVQKSSKTGPLIFRRWSKATEMICTIVTSSMHVSPLSHVLLHPPTAFHHVFQRSHLWKWSHWITLQCFSLHSSFLTPALTGLSRDHHNTFSNAAVIPTCFCQWKDTGTESFYHYLLQKMNYRQKVCGALRSLPFLGNNVCDAIRSRVIRKTFSFPWSMALIHENITPWVITGTVIYLLWASQVGFTSPNIRHLRYGDLIYAKQQGKASPIPKEGHSHLLWLLWSLLPWTGYAFLTILACSPHTAKVKWDEPYLNSVSC